MALFEKYYHLAELLDSTQTVQQFESKAEAIKNQEVTTVVVTGMKSSGKTTAINAMIGTEVQEPGNIGEEHKSLRVSFSPIADDERFQCVMVANRAWNETDAVIYELRDNDIKSNGMLTEDILRADKVFFMISATAPFNINEVNFLKELKRLNCQVIVNGISVVRDVERDKVKGYISRINSSLNLPDVIYIGSNDSEFGKQVRDSLPTYNEQKEMREQRIEILANYLMNILEQELENQRSFSENTDREVRRAADINKKRLHSSCYTLLTDVREDCEKVKRNAITKLDGFSVSMTKIVLSKVNVNSIQTITEEANRQYRDKALSFFEDLRDRYLRTLDTINSSVMLLNLPGWTNETAEELKNKIPNRVDILATWENPKSLSHQLPGKNLESTKILVGTGLVTGGIFLAPIPTILSLVGGIASVGVGGSVYLKKRNEEKESEIEAALEKAFSKGADNIKDFIINMADSCYKSIETALNQCGKRIDEDNSGEENTEVKKRIEEATSILGKLKDNKGENV